MSASSPATLEDLHDVSTASFVEALAQVVRDVALGRGADASTERLARTIAETQIHADLAARENVLRAPDALARVERATYAVKRVKASKAIDDILSREPRLAKGYKAVQRVYAEKHGFALAKASKALVVQKVKDVIAKHFTKGTSRGRAQGYIAASALRSRSSIELPSWGSTRCRPRRW